MGGSGSLLVFLNFVLFPRQRLGEIPVAFDFDFTCIPSPVVFTACAVGFFPFWQFNNPKGANLSRLCFCISGEGGLVSDKDCGRGGPGPCR
jgi:hypothetical protein